MTRDQLIFQIAIEAYGDLAEASQILNHHATKLSAQERKLCLNRVSAAFRKVGDIREVCLGRLSAKAYEKREP